MPHPLSSNARIPLALFLVLVAGCAGAWLQRVQAQAQAAAPAQIGVNAPLPVYVTNPGGEFRLPDGFVQGSRWRFTTWTMPSTLTWTAVVNKTNGGWANLTVTPDDRGPTSRWYYIPAMPGSWERP